jgi:hypothetical protein
MYNLIILSESDDYTVSGLIRYLIKMFYDECVINIFKDLGISIITSKYIKDVLKMTEHEFLSDIKDKEKYLIFGIHPYGWKTAINSGIGIKKIMWQDDLHYFANYIKRDGVSVQRYSKKYYPLYIDEVDYIMTPSSIYFRNLGIHDFDKKILDFFYFLDESKYEYLDNFNFENRINGVVLSGEIANGYDSRVEFNNLKSDKSFDDIIYRLEHPGYKNNSHMTELNYYKEISKYKAAFVGHYVYPLNFLLAKHIEVLMCGCIGFFEPNPLLKSQLGLLEYVHYIPCFDEQGLIKDASFYKKWIDSEEGKLIAKQGKDFVREKFGKDEIISS